MNSPESSVAGASIETELARRVNALILQKAEAWQTEDSLPFLCECGAGGCRDVVHLSAAAYRRWRSLGPVVAKRAAMQTVRFDGELSLYNLDQVRETLAAALEDAAGVLVDLSQVTFIDSTVLGAFVTASGRAAASHIALTFAVPTEGPVRRALTIAGLDRVLTIRDAAAPARIGESP